MYTIVSIHVAVDHFAIRFLDLLLMLHPGRGAFIKFIVVHGLFLYPGLTQNQWA